MVGVPGVAGVAVPLLWSTVIVSVVEVTEEAIDILRGVSSANTRDGAGRLASQGNVDFGSSAGSILVSLGDTREMYLVGGLATNRLGARYGVEIRDIS